MSDIDIEAVRRDIKCLRTNNLNRSWEWGVHDRALSALDQLVKENERLTKENSLLAAGACINPNGNGLLGDDHGNSYCGVERERVALDEQVIDLMARLNEATAKLAAMQEAIVEADRALKQSECAASRRFTFDRILEARSHLRPHLPTPEPEPVDPLVEILAERFGLTEPDYAEELRAAMSARGIEIRKIGEDAARQFRSSDNG